MLLGGTDVLWTSMGCGPAAALCPLLACSKPAFGANPTPSPCLTAPAEAMGAAGVMAYAMGGAMATMCSESPGRAKLWAAHSAAAWLAAEASTATRMERPIWLLLRLRLLVGLRVAKSGCEVNGELPAAGHKGQAERRRSRADRRSGGEDRPVP